MSDAPMRPPKVFLLSPANASGERARMVRNPQAEFPLARKLRAEGAPLGEVFSFVSGLYFRGKLAYAVAFAAPPLRHPPAFVIAPGTGLVPPETVVSLRDLEQMAEVPVDVSEPRYLEALVRDSASLEQAGCEVVLLGSVATGKYVDPLLEVFGERLLFPAEFVGRGDMSRGGLLLRCARSGVELDYIPVKGATRHGSRPPKLPKLPRGH